MNLLLNLLHLQDLELKFLLTHTAFTSGRSMFSSSFHLDVQHFCAASSFINTNARM